MGSPRKGRLESEAEFALGIHPDNALTVSQPSMFSVEDFPVSPTPWLANVADLPTAATCGPSTPDSFASLGPDGSWRKTCQGYSQITLDGSLEAFSETWPRAGMTQSGRAFLLPTWGHRTDATGCGLLPTPTVGDSRSAGSRNLPGSKAHAGVSLTDYVKFGNSNTPRWATPSSRDWKDTPGMARSGTNPDGSLRQRVDQLARQVYTETTSGGALNPTWVEWLMGYPLGWTDCGDSATRSSPKSRSGSSTASKTRKGED
jgi:hypothetical protein